jgi:hypothetical protein
LFSCYRAAAAAKAILPVLLVLGLWIGLFSMVGMQLFRCDYEIDDLCAVISKTTVDEIFELMK